MARGLCSYCMIVALVLGLAACGISRVAPGEPEIRNQAWKSLQPNTLSQNETNWEFIEVKQVIGYQVEDLFESRNAPSACMGPAIAPNEQINPSVTYWFVHLVPIKVTPLPGEISPTAPPRIPEPFTLQALFLLDTTDGRVIARKLDCVIY